MRRDVRYRFLPWLSVLILCLSMLAGCLRIQGPLHNGKAGGYYKTKIAVQGGTGNYQFTLESGALPAGLTLAPNGTIAGTIDSAATGAYTFTVKAVDAVLPQNWFKGEQQLSIQVDDTPYPWTLIVHFAVDNDISYQMGSILTRYLKTLEDIKARDLNNVIQIILMLDAYNKDSRYSDGYYELTGGSINDDLMVPVAEINSGSLNDTEAFLSWAAARYPSEHYIYSIFDHGSGFTDPSPDVIYAYGIGFDESSGNDRLTHNELGQATAYLKQLIGHPIDLFYPFACLMGGVELAYEVRDNAAYLLSSEENFPADVFSYQGLDAILDDPNISTEALAGGMCDQAYQLLANRTLNPRSFTLSLVNLSRIDALYAAIDDYALAALSDINGEQSVAASYNQAADDSFTMQQDDGINDYYMVDLGDYLYHVLISEGVGAAAKTQAETALAALSEAVLYQRQYQYPESSGLTIFHNIWGGDDLYIPSLYRQILLFGANAWTDYVDMVANLAP